ncbi:MAG TPA: hypothetical protein VHV57_17315 [Acidimicrobiales bacterium]|jgi:hypothetical protein|nr:hypothetical protein [Acidimicrobiales bacterium]
MPKHDIGVEDFLLALGRAVPETPEETPTRDGSPGGAPGEEDAAPARRRRGPQRSMSRLRSSRTR